MTWAKALELALRTSNPRPAEPTPELDARIEQAEARFRELFIDPATGRYREDA